VGSAVGYTWRDLLDLQGNVDFLLAGIWAVMAAALCWGVRARRDLWLLAVGAVGGGVIEWWGTNTNLWWYFTRERPPLWILPAWPISTLAIDRLARMLDHGLERVPTRRLQVAYYVLVPGFVAWMTWFARGYTSIFATQVVIGLMVVVALHCPAPRRDVCVFVAGSALGICLEYWGTSRECWTYYTRQIPPPVAAAAHGFAALTFTRAARVLVRWSELALGAVYRQSRKAVS